MTGSPPTDTEVRPRGPVHRTNTTAGPTTPFAAADAPRPAFVRSFEYPRGYPGHRHQHRLAQVVFATRGVVTVETEEGTWLATPDTAVVVAAWSAHRVAAFGNASLRSLFVDPAVHGDFADSTRSVRVTALLHELVGRAALQYPSDAAGDPLFDDVIALALRLLAEAEAAGDAMWVPAVDDPVVAPVAQRLLDDPGDRTPVSELAASVGLSDRHFRRLFLAAAGMTFRRWRALVQVESAMTKLAAGDSVTRVATDLGFAAPSAFIDLFKRHTGMTPTEALRS